MAKSEFQEMFGLACQLLAKPAQIFPTIHIFSLQFTCTWSGPKSKLKTESELQKKLLAGLEGRQLAILRIFL